MAYSPAVNCQSLLFEACDCTRKRAASVMRVKNNKCHFCL